MKRTFFIVLAFLHGAAVAQENPWLPKGENPWVNYPGNEVLVTEQPDSAMTMEDTLVAEEPASFINTVDVDDEDNQEVGVSDLRNTDPLLSESELIELARDEAFDLYSPAADFGFGFSMGLLFNVFSIPSVDVIYMAPESKNEKKTIQRVTHNTEYKSVDDEKLKKAVKNKVKGKKIGMTIAGGLVGSATQCLILLAIIMA